MADRKQDSVARLKAIAERHEAASREPISEWPEEETTLTAMPEGLSPAKIPIAMTLAIPPSQRARVIVTVVAIVAVVIIVLALADRVPGWVSWLAGLVL